jgi:hypothetical protein
MNRQPLEGLQKTVDEFKAEFGPPPGPVVVNQADLLWLRQKFPESKLPRHPFAGLQVFTDDNMPAGMMATDDGRGSPTVMYGIGRSLGAPRHRKLRWNRKRRRERDIEKAAAIAIVYRRINQTIKRFFK